MTKGPLPSKALLDEAFFPYVKHPRPGRCPVKWCRNLSSGQKSLCAKHYMQRWRAKNPYRAYYERRKARAKERGLSFTLTFERFLELYNGHELPVPGAPGDHWTLDRIHSGKGYTNTNCRVILLSENIIKGNKERYDPRYRDMIEQAVREADDLEEIPF